MMLICPIKREDLEQSFSYRSRRVRELFAFSFIHNFNSEAYQNLSPPPSDQCRL